MSLMCIDIGMDTFICRNAQILTLDAILIGLICIIAGTIVHIVLNRNNNKGGEK